MTPDDEPDREPIDPVFASLFRPEDLDPAEPEVGAAAIAEPEIGKAVDELEPEIEPEAMPDSEAAPEPVPAAATSVDTGRLFRSQGVTDHAAAVLALTSDRGGKLRTLARTELDPSMPVRVQSSVAVTGGALLPDDAGIPDDAPVRDSRADRRTHQTSRQFGSSGITAGAVYIIILGVTLLVAFLNAWLGKGELGWPTGMALLISSLYCALRVRREDDVVAIFLPPIAFFLAAITAGQMFRGASGGGLLNRVQLVFFTMAYSWYWVIGTTVVVVVIVLVRRRRD